MTLIMFIVKSFIILAMILLMASPFLMEYFSFTREKEKKISFRRTRMLVYALVYTFVITIVLNLIVSFFGWLEKLSFIVWLAGKFAFSTKVEYCTTLFVTIFINFGIGFLFWFIGRFVRIGYGKKDITKTNEKGEFTFFQKLERKFIKFFHNETWFFVARILKYLNILLSAAYAVIFVLYLITALFGAAWLPYEIIRNIFKAGYIYPTITLITLWQAYFFIEGIKRLEDECPELLYDGFDRKDKVKVDLEAIDEEVKRQFKDYYSCDVALSEAVEEELSSTDHNPITEFIAKAIENDKRNPQIRREAYLDCLDKLVEGNSGLLINGNFFSEFSMYFLRYFSAVVARGDNVVFVCNNDSQIDSVYDYINRAFSEISSLYCKGFRDDAVDLDYPIWRAVKVSGEHNVVEEASVDENSILVTSLAYLCSNRFESEHSKFISLIDAVVFVDSLNTVNTYTRQLAVLNTRLKHLTKQNALASKNGKVSDMFRVRYMSRQIRYICFDDTRTPGLDKVLKNLLAVEFDSADAMTYNPSTIVRCYNYEGKVDEYGRRSYPQFFTSEEEVGAIMNMAVLCLAKGAGTVTVFADDVIPYGNLAETISANMGQISVKADGNNIRINKKFYNPDDYSVVIAMDSGNNLPATLRRYTSMVSDKPALIIVFSKPYMMRDYFMSDVNSMWRTSQLERIPVEEGTKKDIAQKIIVKANAGGISKTELMRLASSVPQFDEYVAKNDVNAVLRGVLQVFGVPQEDRIDLFKYFEYTSSQFFDTAGKYNSEVRIVLRRQGQLFDMINGRDMIVMVTGDSEITLPLPQSRMTQNFIVGQNLIHNGNIYYIQKIDTAAGRIYTRFAVGGKNDEAYRYVQSREYHVELKPEQIESVFPTKHVVMKRSEDNISVNDVYVSVFRAPMEVVTDGYYEIDPHTLAVNSGDNEYHRINDPGNDSLAKQTYRRYGSLESPAYSSESIIRSTNLVADEKGALMMSVRICGEFGENVDRIMSLSAVMLNELIHTMFPSVADSVSVCPVLHGEMPDGEAREVMCKQPRVRFTGESELVSKTDFNLLIIEDCARDLGVVSVLMSAGDDVLATLFNPIFNYLRWYQSTDLKSDYLYYGLDHEPECFDFDSLAKLSKILGDDKHDIRFVDIGTVTEYAVCDFCGKKYAKGDDVIELDDGRKMCKTCAENLVGNNKAILKNHLDRAKIFLESTYGIQLGDDFEFCFESTVKIANTLRQNRELLRRGTDVPLNSYVDDKRRVHVEYDLPSVSLSELLVRELTHTWQIKRLPELADDLCEGHIALVGVQYLRFLGQSHLANTRTTYYETSRNESGEGYRKLVRELLEKPKFNNNPFLYLLDMAGISELDDTDRSDREELGPEDYGLPQNLETSDRITDGELTYFYYPRLTGTMQLAYDALLGAVRSHAERVEIIGCTFEDMVKVSDALSYDHPELFWYNTFSMSGSFVMPTYGATAEEAAVLQRRIDEVVPRYLEGIDDTMSAYDVALRLHVKVISTVDYDTIALNKQMSEGGPAREKIDYLRTVCGVFLEGKAVCEGYARAMQYLLQKCGIECAEVCGHVRKENGERSEAHAWNILKIDGDYYYLDTTWDDSSNTVQSVKSNDLGFNYFCITTEELQRTRDIDLSPADMPPCIATRGNYYYHNGYVLESYDVGKIKEIAQTAAKNKSKSFTFKCKNKALFDRALNQFCAVGQDCLETLKSVSKIDKQIVPNTYSYSYDKNIFTVTIRFKYK